MIPSYIRVILSRKDYTNANFCTGTANAVLSLHVIHKQTEKKPTMYKNKTNSKLAGFTSPAGL
jgi:hypothetical protein